MSLDVQVLDGEGGGDYLAINKHRAAATYDTIPEVLPEGTKNRRQFFREVLRNMNVDGSVNKAEFKLGSAQDYDIYIMKIILVIEDSKVVLDKYGNINALTNGIDLIVSESGVETFIMNSVKTGGEAASQLGITNAVVKIKSTLGESVVLGFNVNEAVPGGIRLGKNTNDFLRFDVNDDLTGLDTHELYIIGYRHID